MFFIISGWLVVIAWITFHCTTHSWSFSWKFDDVKYLTDMKKGVNCHSNVTTLQITNVVLILLPPYFSPVLVSVSFQNFVIFCMIFQSNSCYISVFISCLDEFFVLSLLLRVQTNVNFVKKIVKFTNVSHFSSSTNQPIDVKANLEWVGGILTWQIDKIHSPPQQCHPLPTLLVKDPAGKS